MKRITKFVALFLIVSLAFAGVAAGAGLRTMDRIKLKDGSCQAADVLRTHDRIQDKLKDGSCQAKLTTRTRDRLKDGTCTGSALKTRSRTRTRVTA